MVTMRRAAVFVVLAGAVLLPARASAQSAIAGVVKDASGAVLPGVTVEASSDVLIEKTRSVQPTAPASIASSICGPACTS